MKKMTLALIALLSVSTNFALAVDKINALKAYVSVFKCERAGVEEDVKNNYIGGSVIEIDLSKFKNGDIKKSVQTDIGTITGEFKALGSRSYTEINKVSSKISVTLIDGKKAGLNLASYTDSSSEALSGVCESQEDVGNISLSVFPTTL